jgi:hypothetical protein
MKFSIGDPVRVKRTGEEGKIVDFLDDDRVEVNINGTIFPIDESELEHPYLNWFLQKQKVKKISTAEIVDESNTSKKRKKKDLVQHQPGFSLQFEPKFENDGFEDIITSVHIKLANQSQLHLHLHYECNIKLGNYFNTKTEVLPYQTIDLHDIPYKILLDQPEFKWHIYTSNKEFGPKYQDTLKIKAKKLIELIQKMQLLNEKVFSIQIAEVEDNTPLIEFDYHQETDEKDDFDYFNEKKELKPIYEIDLHIENLEKKHKYLDAFEKLEIQLQAFEDAMNHALKAKQDHLTVIHGVGNGTLKKEIHKRLNYTYEAYCYFIHDYMPKYGMGATQIFFNR